MSDASNQPPESPEPTTIDPDESARFNLQAIINFLEVKPRADLSPGAQEALSWACAAACDAARRIFKNMNKGADE